MSARSELAFTLALVATASGGCSLVNKPDRGQIIIGRDAGPTDAGSFDAGVDAGDGGIDARVLDGGCPQFELQEVSCDNLIDDDCDGLIDCADNAGCGGAPACCGAGGAPEDTPRWPDIRWRQLTRMPADPPVTTSGVITAFGTSGTPQALKHDLCTPLALGLRLTVTLTPQGCASGTCSDSYAGVVFTGAMDFPPSGPLLDDLRVAMRADGIVEVTQNRSIIAVTDTPVTATSTATVLSIELSIGGDAAGHATVFAEVTAPAPPPAPAGTTLTILARRPVIPIGQLVSGPAYLGCDPLAGLYVAVEGARNGVHVGALQMQQLACANPSRFDPPGATIVSGTVRSGTWAAGGIGAPALASYRVTGSPRYDLVYDATNQARSDEAFTPLLFAVGRAKASDVPAPTWSESLAGAPVRSDPSMCLPGDTGAPCTWSVREPTLLSLGAVLDGFVAHAGPGDVYELQPIQTTPDVGAEQLSNPLSMAGPVTAADLSDAFDSGGALLPRCRSLRDPALVFAGRADGSDGFWLFFTCERVLGTKDIRAVKLNSRLLLAGSTHVVVVATPERVGREGALGLHGPEVVTQLGVDVLGARTDAFRVWFVATAGSGRTTIWLAQAQGQAGSAPVFELYPINPILTPSSPELDCEGTCSIGSLSVTRRVNELGQLQFLLARSVDLPDGTRRFELLPMRQVLEELWRSM